MSRIGRWSTVGAAVVGSITVATWNQGGSNRAGADGDGSSPIANPVPDGSQLFLAKGCAACHDGPDSDARYSGGFPSLADASAWADDRRPGMPADVYLTESIAAPEAFISPEFRVGDAGPTRNMPALQLTSEEIEVLVDYLLR